MNLEEYRDSITGRPEYFAYFGDLDLDTWGTMLAVHRDSDVLDRSNWQVISEDMQKRFPDDVTIQGSSHWAVGWVDELKVNTANINALEAAYEWHQEIDSYPIADEDHYSQLEMEEIEECFESYGREETIEFLRENPHLDPGLLDEDGEPIEALTHRIFHLFYRCYQGDGAESALQDVRHEMRTEYERVQPPLQEGI